MPGRRPKIDKIREQRIANEVVVDCYNEQEVYVGWLCYLEDRLRFPLQARSLEKVRGSPLKAGDEVTLTGLLEEETSNSFWAVIEWKGDEISVPLSILEISSGSDAGREAVADWRYWLEQSRQF